MKFILFVVFLLTNQCLAQDFTFSQGGPSSKQHYGEIPYEELNGKLFVTCEIGGKKHRFLFDTGAPVAIGVQLATEIRAKVLTTVSISDVFQKEDSTRIVELNGIKLGNLAFDHIPAAIMTQEFYNCLNVDGVIGSNLLRNSIVRIDSKKKLIIMTDDKDRLGLDIKKSTHMLITATQSIPQIMMVLDNQGTVTLDFDTGDSDFMRLNSDIVSYLKPFHVIDSLDIGYGSVGIGAFGAQKKTYSILNGLVPVAIGNAKFKNLKVTSTDDVVPAIGTKLLDYGVITLNFLDSTFYFDAFKPEVDMFQKRWTTNYGFIDGKIAIAMLWGTSIIRKDSIEPGSQILAIDGLDCTHITFCDYINGADLLKDKETALLTIKNKKGQQNKVRIYKR
ncbi:hypothetical protein ACVWYN_001762 [Pedobacter sp. UYP24]